MHAALQMYAHPLVLNAVPVGAAVATSVTRNVLLTATMGNTLAAWDADSAAPLWSINLGTPLPAGTYPNDHDINGVIGIVSTPVVDRVNRRATAMRPFDPTEVSQHSPVNPSSAFISATTRLRPTRQIPGLIPCCASEQLHERCPSRRAHDRDHTVSSQAQSACVVSYGM